MTVAQRVIVTRPADDAGPWLQALAARGIDAVALPLIAIGPAPDRAALATAWGRLGSCRAALFVSANAVRGFFAERACIPWPSGTRAWAPGPGTASALRAAGVPATLIDQPAADAEQLDSEALWAVAGPQIGPGQRVLIVRGARAGDTCQALGAGRDWLARRVAAAGGTVGFAVAYVRGAPRLDAAQQALARGAARGTAVWLFSSSEAVSHLCEALPDAGWAGAHALATHPRIAATVRAAGFGHVRLCQPSADAVAASIESTR